MKYIDKEVQKWDVNKLYFFSPQSQLIKKYKVYSYVSHAISLHESHIPRTRCYDHYVLHSILVI